MIQKLPAGMMPPPGSLRAGGDTILALVEALEDAIDRAAVECPAPGTRAFQRLNRAEYQKSIRALLDLSVPTADYLTLDTRSGGFDPACVHRPPRPLPLSSAAAAAAAAPGWLPARGPRSSAGPRQLRGGKRPASAGAADRPEPPAVRIEGDPVPGGEVCQQLVGGKGDLADQTAREHDGWYPDTGIAALSSCRCAGNPAKIPA